MLVLDNASDDGSAGGCARVDRALARDRRRGAADRARAANRQGRQRLSAARRGPRRVLPAAQRGLRAAAGATEALLEALRARPEAGGRRGAAARPGRRAAALRVAPAGPRNGARRARCSCTACSSPRAAAIGHREVGWVQSAAMLVRRRAAARDRLPRPGFLRLFRRDRLLQAPRRRRLGGPLRPGRDRDPPRAARHRPRGEPEADRRVSSRPRPLHAKAPFGAACRRSRRVLSAWTYLPRALAALVLPGHDPRRYLAHARAALRPSEGEGLREAAASYNRSSSRAAAS